MKTVNASSQEGHLIF